MVHGGRKGNDCLQEKGKATNGAAVAASSSQSRFWNKHKGPSIALSASIHTEVILDQVDSRTFSLILCFYWTLLISPDTYHCQPLSLTDSLIAHICLPALSDVLREAPFWNVLFPYGHCPFGGGGGTLGQHWLLKQFCLNHPVEHIQKPKLPKLYVRVETSTSYFIIHNQFVK